MRTHVLVAGVDYEFKGVDFRIFCNNRVKRLIAANKKKEELQFQIFDIRKGDIVTHEVSFPGGKKTEKISSLSPSPFRPVTKANFDRTVSGSETHYRLKDGQSAIISILDVYRAVQKIGADAPGTLVELSFFSHAWMGGPILLNSHDDGSVMVDVPMFGPTPFAMPSGARDPDDFDPRSKDFSPPIMDAAELTKLQDAFETNGFVWMWGCSFPRLVHEILHKIERHKLYKDSGLDGEVEFEITNFNSAQADLLELWIESDIGGPFPDKKKIKIKFKFIKHFFCKITTASYARFIATNAKKKTFAGVMGTYSEYDSGKLPLMSVHPGFGRHFTFYKNYLGFKFDPEGRHYGEYDPAFACTTPSP